MRWEPIDQLTHGPYHSLSLSSDFFVKFVVVQERVNERFVKVVLFHFITSFSPPPVVIMVLSSPFLLTYKTYIFVNGHFIVWHSSIGCFSWGTKIEHFDIVMSVFWGVIQKDVCVRSRGANYRDKRNANEVLCFMVHYAIVCIFYIILRAIVCCYITFESPFFLSTYSLPKLEGRLTFFFFFCKWNVEQWKRTMYNRYWL